MADPPARLPPLADQEPWSRLIEERLFDDTWFIDCDIDEAMRRVYERQVANGKPPEVVSHRIETNDRPNAELVEATKQRARLVLPSLPLGETEISE